MSRIAESMAHQGQPGQGQGQGAGQEQRERWGGHRDERLYWGSFCMNLGSSCVHYTIQGMRGDPLGVLSSSSGAAVDDSDYTSDVTHDSPRTSTTNTAVALDRGGGSSRQPPSQLHLQQQQQQQQHQQQQGVAGLPTLAASMGSGRAECGGAGDGFRMCGLGRIEDSRGGGGVGGAHHDCFTNFVDSCAPAASGSAVWRIAHSPMFCSRVALMIMVTMVVVVFAVSAYNASFYELRRSVTSASLTAQGGILQAAQDSFQRGLETNAASAQALARLLASSLPTSTSISDYQPLLQQVAPYLWIAYATRPDTGLLGFLAATGEFFAYSSTRNTSLLYAGPPSVQSSYTSTSPLCITPASYDWYYQPVDQSTGRPTNGTSTSSLDCFLFLPNPSLVQEALDDSGRAFWTTSMTADGDVLLLSMQAIVLPGSLTPAGVMLTSTSLSSVAYWLGKQDLHNGDFFVTDEQGQLVVQSGLPNPPPVAPQQQLSAEYSNNPVVAAASQYLDVRLGNMSSLAVEHYVVENAKINGGRYRIESVPLDTSCKCLVAVVVIPRKTMLGYGGHRLLLIFSCVALALVLVGCFLVLLLTKGVSGAMQREQSYIAQVKAVKSVEKRAHHKHQFFANMSHDLRTPLAAIIGLIDMILSDKASIASELEASMVQMKSCANSLLGIMNSILDLSNIEGGKLEFNPSDFDLVSTLEEVVDTFAVVGLKKDVEVVLDLPDDSIDNCKWVNGDSRHVKQVLSNLLSNAVKFTGEGGQVVVRAWPKPVHAPSVDDRMLRRPQGWLRRLAQCGVFRWHEPTSGNVRNGATVAQDSVEYEFEVDDTGIGIPPARREAVFHNFVQASSRVHRVHGGTGLGLAVVRSLVHVMGGHIWVANKQEPGTLIKFDLTFQKASKEVPPRSARRFFISGKGRESSADNFRKSVSIRPLTLAQHLIKEDSRLSLSARREEGDVQVLLAMQGKAGKQLVYTWMEKRGAVVWDVPEWNDIPTTFRCIISNILHHGSPQSSPQSYPHHVSPRVSYRQTSPSRCSPPRISSCSSLPEASKGNVQEVLPLVIALIDVALIPQGKEFQPGKFRAELENYRRSSSTHGYFLHLVWIVSPDAGYVASATWQSLRTRSDSTLSKPVHGSRLAALAEEINSRYRKDVAGEKRRSFLLRPPSPSRLNNSSTSTSSGQGQGQGQEGKKEPIETAPPQTQSGRSSPDRGRQSTDIPGVPCSKDSPVRDSEERRNGNGGWTVQSVAGPLDHVQLEIVEAEGIEVGPVLPAKRAPREAATPKPLVAEETGGRLAGVRILLVEDTVVMQRIASQLLRKEGALVKVAGNGKEAVEMVAELVASPSAEVLGEPSCFQNVFDLVLMDCQMPVMDGYTATVRIREIEGSGHLPIIALTAHGGMESDQQKCMDAGMDAYISKPLNMDTLLDAMHHLNIVTNRES